MSTSDEFVIRMVREQVAGLRSEGVDIPDVATVEAVERAEEALGHPMPPLLRRLYLDVSNGGFGPPPWGVIGVRGGWNRYTDHRHITEPNEVDPDGLSSLFPPGTALLAEWGASYATHICFQDPQGEIWASDDHYYWRQPLDLATWLVRCIEGPPPHPGSDDGDPTIERFLLDPGWEPDDDDPAEQR